MERSRSLEMVQGNLVGIGISKNALLYVQDT